jgi:hypothetical protein
MTRKEFYDKYYEKTDRRFGDKFVWGRCGYSEENNRKGQLQFSKLERKIYIILNYISLFVFVGFCIFANSFWIYSPIVIILHILYSIITDFSIIKIEMLYRIHKTKTVYCSVLCKVFSGEWSSSLDSLKRLTKRTVLGFYKKSGGKFWGKYCAICRNKNNSIIINFKVRCVDVKINNQVLTINKPFDSEEQLILEIASVINNSPHLKKQ